MHSNVFKNPKSSTDLDEELSKSLSKFDTLNDCFFRSARMGQLFMHKKDIFRKISKKKRYLCEKVSNGKLYLFQPNTLIFEYKNEKDNNFYALILAGGLVCAWPASGNLFRNNLLILQGQERHLFKRHSLELIKSSKQNIFISTNEK